MELAQVFAKVAGPGEPVRFTAYDGSAAGPADAAVTVDILSTRAVSYLLTSPPDLGLARAVVQGDIAYTGDTHAMLRRLQHANAGALSWPERLEVVRALGPGILRPPAKPALEARLRGRRHSKARDAAAISHHYDVSNRFYELVLGPSMAYTCACYPTQDATLEQAQEHKHDLVARKLGLREGMRLLDVGCGWGGMVMHAAREYGVQALGVTLSRRQAEWAAKAIADAGLTGLAEVRFLDYRDVPADEVAGGYDAVSSIGLTEHIGRAQLPSYVASLAARLKPGGRLLNHCIMRPDSHGEALKRNGFVDRYVFPDGELSALGPIVTAIQDNGFEVRHTENLREHYSRTCQAWGANLDAHWDEAVAEVGQARALVWRLYLAGSRLGFERNEIQLHQVLAVKVDGPVGVGQADAHMPLRPDWGV